MKTYMITGATGFIGHTIAETLRDKQVQLVLPVRNLEKAKKMYPDTTNITFVNSDLENLKVEDFPMDIDYIIHCAAVTVSKEMVTSPVEVADGILIGTKNILNIAKEKNVESMVFLSSMEAYGHVADDGARRSEYELGDIDVTSARSCYPMGKRMAELYCYLYANEYNVPVKVARLAQVFGSGVLPTDTRVFMQFARSANEGKDIVLKTKGMSVGNYCETRDAVSGILTILEKGKSGETYNVVNEENTMRISEMAELVCREIAEKPIQVVFDIEDSGKTGYAADTGLRMSSKKLESLGWKAQYNLIDMYHELIHILNS